MNISANTKLFEIQEWFQANYSNLKLAFYYKSIKDGDLNYSLDKISLDTKLSELNRNIKEFDFDLKPNKLVSEFEKDFKLKFGFEVQVLRKSGNLWLQTIASDDWTLDEQQEESLKMNTKLESDEIIDYHEQE